MSAPSTSGLSVELLLRVIDVKYGCFTLLYFFYWYKNLGDTTVLAREMSFSGCRPHLGNARA